MSTDKNTKSDRNTSGHNEIVDKNIQALSSLKEKLVKAEETEEKEPVWLQKFGKNTVSTKMSEMSNKHLQNAYYSVQHKMEEHYKKMNVLEDLLQKIESVAEVRNLTLRDIDGDYTIIREKKAMRNLKHNQTIKK